MILGIEACPCCKMSWVRPRIEQRFNLDAAHHHHHAVAHLYSSSGVKQATPTPAPAPSGSGSRLSPTAVFIIVAVAVLFLISGLLHLFVRFLMKHRSSLSDSESDTYPEIRDTNTFHRQLQQLFHLHDSGLDQAFIDALPVFMYKEIMGLKEPFDCAVCLCEFSEQDKLRLLPLCSHAFHINCIDTWLLSNSTCPLCRGTLFSPGFAIENPVFEFQTLRDDLSFSGSFRDRHSFGRKPGENDISKRVFSVRLGKFRNINPQSGRDGNVDGGETSSSNLDARRCYSLGSCQYVEADSDLQVTLCETNNNNSSNRSTNGGVIDVRIGRGLSGNPSMDGDVEGKKLSSRSKVESYSVSKIWLWSNKGKLSGAPNAAQMGTSSFIGNFPSDR
uniref:RING-type E3 ubiquitin transferase n=1 Tax=Kalanchoe fedtschenkoi TaxID=63787 RepID=A0A7N0UKM8_KALFE